MTRGEIQESIRIKLMMFFDFEQSLKFQSMQLDLEQQECNDIL